MKFAHFESKQFRKSTITPKYLVTSIVCKPAYLSFFFGGGEGKKEEEKTGGRMSLPGSYCTQSWPTAELLNLIRDQSARTWSKSFNSWCWRFVCFHGLSFRDEVKIPHAGKFSKAKSILTKLYVAKKTVNEYCRFCEKSLCVLYVDKLKSVSTENLFEPSKIQSTRGQVLSQLLQRIGLVAEKQRDLSHRVCKVCARKTRKTVEGFKFFSMCIAHAAESCTLSGGETKDVRMERALASNAAASAFP